MLLDYMDMNGDRYPDVVTPNKIQYMIPTGGLSGEAVDHQQRGENHQTSTKSSGVSLSDSTKLPERLTPYAFNTKRGAVIVGSGKTSAGLNGSFGKGTNETDFTWMDLNGDGLPDRVWLGQDQMGAGEKLHVRLNLGYTFSETEVWDFDHEADQHPDEGIAIGKGSSKSYGGEHRERQHLGGGERV